MNFYCIIRQILVLLTMKGLSKTFLTENKKAAMICQRSKDLNMEDEDAQHYTSII